MKKLMLLVLMGGFLFTSCQKDDLSSQTELEAVDGKGNNKVKEDKKEKEDLDAEEEESCVPNILSLETSLPDAVNVQTTAKGRDADNSYFTITIEDSDLAGEGIAAWCVDADLSLEAGESFSADAYSSYETLPSGAFEFPENFDLVNWIINQNFIGQESSDGTLFTFGDVQQAIWGLVDDRIEPSCTFCGSWTTARATEIIEAAKEFGEGFIPACNQKVAVILIPLDKQAIIFFIDVPCDCNFSGCETAFARDDSGNTCFDEYGFSRWGWTIGPITEGDYTYDVYAGAGQCDISKGTFVGTVDIAYGGGTVDVTYNLNAGVNINAEHTYAGYDPIPKNPKNGRETVAPGQYEITKDLEGDIYVILHTEVCGD